MDIASHRPGDCHQASAQASLAEGVLHLGSERAYLDVRATVDGRVICGGEDEEFADETRRDAKLDRKTEVLEKKLARLLPKIDPRADFAWTASFGQSKTGLPRVGPLPGYPRCYGVLGYGGNGITYSMLASQLVSASIAGRKDSDAKLFAFR